MDGSTFVHSKQVNDWLLFTQFFIGDKEKSQEIVKAWLIKPSTKFQRNHVMERGFRYILKQMKGENRRRVSKVLLSEYSFKSIKEIDQAIILLHYYFQLEIKKIARIVRKSKREIRKRLFSFLQVLSTKGITVHTFNNILHAEIMTISLPLTPVVTKGIKINRKKTALYSLLILHFLIVGGAMNSGIVEKTQAKQGPDLLTIYRDGTFEQQLKKDLEETFQKEPFAIKINFEESEVSIGIFDEVLYRQKAEIITFVNQFLKEKDIPYIVQLDYMEETIGDDEIAYQVIIEANAKGIKLWPGDYSEQEKVMEWVLALPDAIELVTEHAEVTRAQGILKKYNHKAPLIVSHYDKDRVDRQERWLELTPYFEEGFLLGKEYNIESISINAYTKEVSIDVYTYFLTKDSNKEEIARAVKRSIDQFLQSEEVKQIVQNDAYTINIYSAGKKKIKIHY
ncbi:DUF4030 domain-containing protein [Niallia circulans]|uniref:DUF4030 domain-containing protein n=1 Tax=Niallia circulans TaxID=1397 RepID=A0A941GM28_NIACI|nr:DUF4030 domain-containing protein [Niallia circulans]MCB5238525.1 DUF4030 domain-containing protein [Niallia circulans]